MIDKINNVNQMMVTLSELTTEANPEYEMELFNFFTNVTYLWKSVNVTVVSTNERIDVVEINLQNEEEGKVLEEGQYRYIFYEIIGINRIEVEKGLLKVVNTGSTDNIYEIKNDEDDDDFIVFT
jgi:hypothetical protein